MPSIRQTVTIAVIAAVTLALVNWAASKNATVAKLANVG